MTVQLDEVRQQRWTGAFADVREAREFAARSALGWSVHEVEDLCLVTSELATNAVVHARTGFSVVVGLTNHSIAVEVTDGSDVLPVLERYPSRCESGRGLLLVDALSQRWGADLVPAGKTVWAVLGLGGRPPDHAREGGLSVGPAPG